MVGALKFYTVTWPQNGEGGVASTNADWSLPSFSGEELLLSWTTPTFSMEGRFVDFQPNNGGVKLFSQRMRQTVDQHKAANDRLEWLPLRIARGRETQTYFILHLLDELDVIDRKRSILIRTTGDVIKAHLRAELVGDHQIFTYSNKTGLIILFTERIYEAMKSCSGCSFRAIPASGPEARA